jgi:epoxyqueuosine reductase
VCADLLSNLLKNLTFRPLTLNSWTPFKDSIKARFSKFSIDFFFAYSSLCNPQLEKYCSIRFCKIAKVPIISIYLEQRELKIMVSKASITNEVISQAESYEGIRAGIVRLEDVLKGPSYNVTLEGQGNTDLLDDVPQGVDWPSGARTVLVLGMNHPEKEPRLDYWEQGDSWGNRHLREISESLKQWLREKYNLAAHPLPYHVEKGGLFLKDAAVLSGIGIIGRNNLLLHPNWGPRIRLRSILLEGDWQPTEALEGFFPCETCKVFCQKACPVKAFPRGKYSRPICEKQMNTDVENIASNGEIGKNGKPNLVIRYCRACELSCPVGG